MKHDGCTGCAAAGKDCGGHWNRKVRPLPERGGTRGRVTLDVIDDTPDEDANAYQMGEASDD